MSVSLFYLCAIPGPVWNQPTAAHGYGVDIARFVADALGCERRIGKEVNLGYTEQQMVDESQRCMSCASCFDCGTCWSFCQDQAIVKPLVKGEPYTFKMDFCQGCKKCAEECPCGFIEMV